MKIYRVTLREDIDAHAGYKYFLKKSEANALQKLHNDVSCMDDEVKTLVLSMNQHDVIDFLNKHCAYPDNG